MLRDAWAQEGALACARARARAAPVAGAFFELSLICHTNWENSHFEKRVPRTLARRRRAIASTERAA
jgi:hypothetical protein